MLELCKYIAIATAALGPLAVILIAINEAYYKGNNKRGWVIATIVAIGMFVVLVRSLSAWVAGVEKDPDPASELAEARVAERYWKGVVQGEVCPYQEWESGERVAQYSDTQWVYEDIAEQYCAAWSKCNDELQACEAQKAKTVNCK